LVIEEKEEDLNYVKTLVKKSLLTNNNMSKPLERKKNYPNFNKTLLTKTVKCGSNVKLQSNHPRAGLPIVEKKERKHFDFLQGFKDKLKSFLKNKNKKQFSKNSTPIYPNRIQSPLISHGKPNNKSVSSTPILEKTNFRTLETSNTSKNVSTKSTISKAEAMKKYGKKVHIHFKLARE
jgi:hypothetical protein